MNLKDFLAREQWAFLRRDRAEWSDHLERVRGFMGEGLKAADPGRPVLILGAGAGLEIPWNVAPRGTVGWDADPWSRMWTLARHRRWAPWVFEDVTGGYEELLNTTRRCLCRTWSGQRREHPCSVARLTGLLPTLNPSAELLRRWIAQHRPGTILAANLMGQFGSLAERLVEVAFAPRKPWEEDPERPDPLSEALDAWTARAVRAFLGALTESGARLWLVHDRGVVFGEAEPVLGSLVDPWPTQLVSHQILELSDPLVGVDVKAELDALHVEQHERWLWSVGPGQTHVVEAISAHP